MLQGIARASALAMLLVTSSAAVGSAAAKLIFKVAFVPDTTGSTAQHKDIVVNVAQAETARDTMGVWRAIARMDEGDIVADVKAGRARLDVLKDEELPGNVRELAPAERKAFLDRQMRVRKVSIRGSVNWSRSVINTSPRRAGGRPPSVPISSTASWKRPSAHRLSVKRTVSGRPA